MDNFKFQITQPRTFLEEIIPKETRIYLNSCTKIGYELALGVFSDKNSWLNDLRGKFLLPRVKSLGVEYMISKYCDNGLINLRYSVEYTSEKNNTFLLFTDPDKKINLIANQTTRADKPSRYARYRAEKINNFESYFDFESQKLIDNRPVYVELNHGYQTDKPAFSVLGIPQNSKEWYSLIPLHKEELLIIPSKDKKFATVQKEVSDFDYDDFEEFVREKEN